MQYHPHTEGFPCKVHLSHLLSGVLPGGWPLVPSKTSPARYISFVCTLEQKPRAVSVVSASTISAGGSAGLRCSEAWF